MCVWNRHPETLTKLCHSEDTVQHEYGTTSMSKHAMTVVPHQMGSHTHVQHCHECVQHSHHEHIHGDVMAVVTMMAMAMLMVMAMTMLTRAITISVAITAQKFNIGTRPWEKNVQQYHHRPYYS